METTKEKTKIKLIDRITINSILPDKGNLKELTIRNDIREKVQLKQTEFEDFEMKFTETTIGFNQKGSDAEFEFEFTDAESDEMKSILNKLNEKSELTIQSARLCKIFNVK